MILIICGILLLVSAALCGKELLDALESARWGISGAIGAGSLVAMIDHAGQALIELASTPPAWKLLAGGLLLHWSFRP
ncbi:MAG: hypothetical protein JJ992_20695 [Planctomycetes bacterium]|nr:hypothetical protein [Planctomycetota bacterium]